METVSRKLPAWEEGVSMFPARFPVKIQLLESFSWDQFSRGWEGREAKLIALERTEISEPFGRALFCPSEEVRKSAVTLPI